MLNWIRISNNLLKPSLVWEVSCTSIELSPRERFYKEKI